MSISRLHPALPVPTGVDRFGFPAYGPLPGGVPNPPNAWHEARELAVVRELNARAHASPDAAAFTAYLAEEGGTGLWWDLAKQYRHAAGFTRGWAGTGVVALAMGSATLRTQLAKRGYDRLRPYQVDPSIRPIGKLPKDPGYPSGHTASAYAAATALSQLWPARAHEYAWWARQVGLSRVHGGVHFPSDVQAGARVGLRSGLIAGSILR